MQNKIFILYFLILKFVFCFLRKDFKETGNDTTNMVNLSPNIALNNYRLTKNHNDFILIEYEAIGPTEHKFAISIAYEYLKKYAEFTYKNIFTKTKYSISAERVSNFDFHEFFSHCFEAENAQAGSNESYSVDVNNDKLEINYLVEFNEEFFDNFINFNKNILFIDNCINHPLEFGYLYGELKLYMPKEIKKIAIL